MKKPISSKPSKQRKWLARAPAHSKRKMIASTLSPDLREKYSRRSIPVRVKDVIKIMRGAYRGKKGEVLSVNTKKRKITIEGIVRKKTSGEEVAVNIDPSNVMVTELFLDDKMRRKVLNRKVEDVEEVKAGA